MYTLGQAAKATGKTKGAIANALSKGRISGRKDDFGNWAIDPAELHRVYPPLTVQQKPKLNDIAPPIEHQLHTENIELKAAIKAAQRELDMLQSTINDLRADRDAWREQASHLKMLVAPNNGPKDPPRGIWRRLFGK